MMYRGIEDIINEAVNYCIRGIINEGLSDTLYHFTSLQAGFSIAKDDIIYLQSAFSKDSDNYDKKRKFYLSCTRIYSSQFGYSKRFSGEGVRITLDGRKLSERFKGKAINYWNGLNDKYSYYKSARQGDDDILNDYPVRDFKEKNPNASEEELRNFIKHNYNKGAQSHIDNESEDRLVSYEPYIMNAHEYIKSFDVLIQDIGEDKSKRDMAYGFMITKLGNKIHIFDSLEQFNNLNGKDINAKVMSEYYSSTPYNGDRRMSVIRTDTLVDVVSFIAYSNPEYEGKNFGQSVARLLQKYSLYDYKSLIPKIDDRVRRSHLMDIAGSLDSKRRDLSDNPNSFNSKVLKMLTDYILSIGANSFREACRKKNDAIEYKYAKIYDRIDTQYQRNFLIINNVIVADPSKTLFKDTMRLDDEGIRNLADTMSYDIFDDIAYSGDESRYSTTSKNHNSLFQYMYKMFRSGTVSQVLEMFRKLGCGEDVMEYNNIEIRQKSMNYWKASDYYTPKQFRYMTDNKNYDWKKASKIRDEELETYFPKIKN